MCRRLILVFGFLLWHHAANSSENILLLNSYHRGFSWTDEITEAIRQTLENNGNVNLFVEYLDSKRFSDSLHFAEFRRHISEKYSGLSFRVIITSDNDALDFVLANQLNRDGTVPVAFCGISNYQDYDLENAALYGVIETDDWEPILDCIISIQGDDFESFYFIVENSPTGMIRKRSVEKAFNTYRSKVRVNYIENYSYNNLIEHVKEISGKSVIYYPGIGTDYLDQPVNAEKCGVAIIKNANVPVYTSYLSLIDSGAIGGYVGSGRIQGIETANLALMLIRGTDRAEVPKITIPRREFIFNYRISREYGIDFGNLPKNTVFINRPPSILSAYRKEVVSTLILILVLSGIVLMLFLNIIRRIRAERQIRESEKKFREIAEMLPETVFECDISGKIIFMNKFGRENFGYSREEIVSGIEIPDLISPGEHYYINQSIQKLINGREPISLTFNAVRKDGSTFPFEIHSSLIVQDEETVGIRGIGINVTRQKKFERELIEAKKKAEESDKLKSAFLANMSHEIRTPLNSIVGFSYLMSERTLSEDETRKMAMYIKNSSDHLLMLINDIIDISKIEAGQLDLIMKELNISDVLEEISLYVEREKERTDKEHIRTIIRNNISGSALVICSDALRLKQILLNLTSNALKFTEDGEIEIGCQSENSDVIFYIKDSGVGITEEFREKVFQRFTKMSSFRGRVYPGFGLGLAISKQLSELLKGKLWCEPNKDKGTTFFLSLPAINSHPEILNASG